MKIRKILSSASLAMLLTLGACGGGSLDATVDDSDAALMAELDQVQTLLAADANSTRRQQLTASGIDGNLFEVEETVDKEIKGTEIVDPADPELQNCCGTPWTPEQCQHWKNRYDELDEKRWQMFVTGKYATYPETFQLIANVMDRISRAYTRGGCGKIV